MSYSLQLDHLQNIAILVATDVAVVELVIRWEFWLTGVRATAAVKCTVNSDTFVVVAADVVVDAADVVAADVVAIYELI